jgi:hypothetical protein
VRELVNGIHALLDAVETLRKAGARADLPPELVAACRDLVAADDDPTRPRRRGRASHEDLMAIPLRRLVWKVMTPGETVTVPQVTERLSELGVQVPAPKVSNAMGYWVARDELLRRRKGVYYYPLPADGASGAGRDGGPMSSGLPNPAGRDTRPADAGREQEDSDAPTGGTEVTRRAG